MFYLAPLFVFTQVCVGANDHLSFPVVGLFEVQRSDSFLLELRVLLVEKFTPDRNRHFRLTQVKTTRYSLNDEVFKFRFSTRQNFISNLTNRSEKQTPASVLRAVWIILQSDVLNLMFF